MYLETDDTPGVYWPLKGIKETACCPADAAV